MSDGGRAREPGALDRPLATALISLAVACVVVAVRLAANEGDISRFVRAAPPWTDPASVPAGLTVVAAGYDGQFYYRLALDPLTDRRTSEGITLDLPAYRQQRIVYPLLAWLASGADAGRLPIALIGVNVAFLGMLGWLAGILSRRSGRHALWGLLFTAYPGFVMTLTRDLTEIVAATFVVASLLLLRADRTLAASAALTLSVLTRETTVILAASAGLVRLITRTRDAAAWLPLVLPGVVMVAWQVFLVARWHEFAASQGSTALYPPLLGLAGAMWFNPGRMSPAVYLAWLAVIVFVGLLVSLAMRSARHGQPPLHERLAWSVYLGLALLFEVNIWANGAVLRALTELAMLSALFVLTARARWRWTLLGAELIVGAVVLWAGTRI